MEKSLEERKDVLITLEAKRIVYECMKAGLEEVPALEKLVKIRLVKLIYDVVGVSN